jgi:replicative DNA helicase
MIDSNSPSEYPDVEETSGQGRAGSGDAPKSARKKRGASTKSKSANGNGAATPEDHNGTSSENVISSRAMERVPPHSIEAEQGALGCALLDPNECIGQCVEFLKAGKEAFYDLRHREAYEVLVEMYETREAIDLITLHQKLKDRNLLQKVGGMAYLSSLMEMVPSPANLSYYLEIVKEKHTLRRLVKACGSVTERIYEYEGDVDKLLDEVERDVLQVGQDRVDTNNVPMKVLIRRAITTVEDFHQRQGALTGVSTGFHDLDRMTTGLHGGEMVVIAARPSMGKTSFAMNIVEHAILEEKIPVGVFSLEMTSDSLALRMLCSLSRVNLRNIREGIIMEHDFPKITASAGKLINAPLHIDDTPGLSILQLRAKARRMSQQHGIKLFVIDYLQLLHSTAKRAENRQQEIADISNGVKALAKELNVPVIVLSQLNRELEKDKSRKPRLSDLRESGSIEQDADLVGLLYKPHVEEEADDDEDAAPLEALPVNLLIAKQRNGPTGDVRLTFLKGFTRFESASKVGAADIPE